MNGTGSSTTHHSRGVHIEVTSVLDLTETTIDAKQAGRDDIYRIEVDGASLGFVVRDGDRWKAKTLGQIEGDTLDAADLEDAARAAAELFTGRTIR